MKRRRFAPISKILLIALVLYGSVPIVAQSQTLKESEVLELAKAAAKKEGYDLSKFQKPEAHFEFTSKNEKWVVFYEGKLDKQGNSPIGAHFLIQVHDKTKKVEVFAGR